MNEYPPSAGSSPSRGALLSLLGRNPSNSKGRNFENVYAQRQWPTPNDPEWNKFENVYASRMWPTPDDPEWKSGPGDLTGGRSAPKAIPRNAPPAPYYEGETPKMLPEIVQTPWHRSYRDIMGQPYAEAPYEPPYEEGQMTPALPEVTGMNPSQSIDPYELGFRAGLMAGSKLTESSAAPTGIMRGTGLTQKLPLARDRIAGMTAPPTAAPSGQKRKMRSVKLARDR